MYFRVKNFLSFTKKAILMLIFAQILLRHQKPIVILIYLPVLTIFLLHKKISMILKNGYFRPILKFSALIHIIVVVAEITTIFI